MKSYVGLITSQLKMADSLEGNSRTKTYQQVDSICIELLDRYPHAREYATFLRARCNALIDVDSSKAKDYGIKLYDIAPEDPIAKKVLGM